MRSINVRTVVPGNRPLQVDKSGDLKHPHFAAIPDNFHNFMLGTGQRRFVFNRGFLHDFNHLGVTKQVREIGEFHDRCDP